MLRVHILLFLFTSGFAHAQEKVLSVDGFNLHVKTAGLESREPGTPVLVLESGYGTPMDHWDRVFEGFAEMAPVVAYDRPGIGASEPDEEMPTVKNVADKLIKVLEQLDVSPPYILVGHSQGGAYVRGFSGYYPEKVVGLVIIDPADFTETQENKRDYYDVLGWDEERIDEEFARLEEVRLQGNTDLPESLQEERQVLREMRETDFKELRQHPLPNIPVHIITGGRFDMPERFRSTEYDDEVLFRSKMQHRTNRWIDVIQSVDKGMFFYSADAGHFVHYDDPELVISSVRIILADQ